MILHALWKNTFFQKSSMVFSLLLLTPPPPGLAKDHKKYGFFFRNPSLSGLCTTFWRWGQLDSAWAWDEDVFYSWCSIHSFWKFSFLRFKIRYLDNVHFFKVTSIIWSCLCTTFCLWGRLGPARDGDEDVFLICLKMSKTLFSESFRSTETLFQ